MHHTLHSWKGHAQIFVNKKFVNDGSITKFTKILCHENLELYGIFTHHQYSYYYHDLTNTQQLLLPHSLFRGQMHAACSCSPHNVLHSPSLLCANDIMWPAEWKPSTSCNYCIWARVKLIHCAYTYYHWCHFQAGGECTVSRTLTHDLTQYPPTTSAGSPTKVKAH